MNDRAVESAYWQELTIILQRALQDGHDNFDDILELTAGAFPTDVLKVAHALGIDLQFSKLAHDWDDRLPSPSPAQSEFYFTRDSAIWLASKANGRTVCLGTPTIAREVARTGQAVTLVDSSPWLNERFGPFTGLDNFEQLALVEHTDFTGDFDTAFLDPPWYFPVLPEWIRIASRAVRTGGHIFLPLISNLSRPAARGEVTALLEMVELIGPSIILDQVVLYESPRFERIAIERGGGHLGRPWRSARVLQIENRFPVRDVVESNRPNEWKDYRSGDSIVSIRQATVGQRTKEDEFFILDTVSRRDERVRRANVWTSESTAARVEDPAKLAAALSGRDALPPVLEKLLTATLKRLEIAA